MENTPLFNEILDLVRKLFDLSMEAERSANNGVPQY